MNDESSELFFILLAEMISSFFSTSGDGCCIKKKKNKKNWQKSIATMFFSTNLRTNNVRDDVQSLNEAFGIKMQVQKLYTRSN
jgi:hypothetical protein